MEVLYTPITIDLITPNPLPVLNAKQGDTARGALITLTAGSALTLTDETVRVFINKPDSHIVYADCEIENGKVKAAYSYQMVAAAGKAELEIEIDDGSRRLSTPIAILQVMPSNISEDAIESTDEMSALKKVIVAADSATNAASAAANNANEAAENVKDGVSPTISVSDITGGHRLTITDANGAKTVDVMDGAKGDDGEDYVLTAADKAEIAETVKEKVPLVKTAEQPTFVNSIEEMTDASKVYVMPDGYLYGYREEENYNLLKLSEVSYSSRLQNDVSGIVSSNNANLVTGWIPVQYGKYYTPSVVIDGVRQAYMSSTAVLITRINLKLDDGTIVVYNNTASSVGSSVVQQKSNETIKILYENAVSMMVHICMTGYDISTSALFELYEPMIIESATPTEVYDKLSTYEYINGDVEAIAEWYNTGLVYNQPVDYEARVIELESDVTDLQERMTELEGNVENPTSASPYYRDVNFGVLPFMYYQGLAESYENEGFGRATQYAAFMSAWKSLVSNHGGYVTETVLGTASDGQAIYLYDFKPVRITNQDKPIPKIIIIAGQHGGETCNIFGLYYFVSNLLNKWNQHPALEYLRNHVELMIVPVLNTYGFDNQSYKNANGVNLNRNYDSNWALLEDTTSNQYGGAEPFDQPETQIVRDLLLNNTDAVLIVDSHVNGGGVVDEYSDINYYGISISTDNYFNRMVDAVAHNLSAISANFNLDYELGQPDEIMGFLNHSDGVGLLRNYARDKNLVSVLVEGFGGFPNRTSFTAEVFKANEEIIVNWLITAMNYLSK